MRESRCDLEMTQNMLDSSNQDLLEASSSLSEARDRIMVLETELAVASADR